MWFVVCIFDTNRYLAFRKQAIVEFFTGNTNFIRLTRYVHTHTHIPIPFVVLELGRINLSGVCPDKIIFYNEFSSLSSSMYLTRRCSTTETESNKLFSVVIFSTTIVTKGTRLLVITNTGLRRMGTFICWTPLSAATVKTIQTFGFIFQKPSFW